MYHRCRNGPAGGPLPRPRYLGPVLASLLACICTPLLALEDPPRREDGELRASERSIAPVRRADFVYSVAKFVTWPLSGLEGRRIRLCTMGSDTLGEAEERLDGRFVHGRRLDLRQIEDLAQIPACNILFLGPDQVERLDAICTVAADHAVLTLAATEGFAERCVMINMRPARQRLAFEVNHHWAVRARLKVSSELLKLGDIVSGPTVGSD